jgi:hypothetical protein
VGLDAVGKPLLYVPDEGVGVGGIPCPEPPSDHQLAVGVQSRPGPYTADARLPTHTVGQVFVLGVAELPYLIVLNPPGLDVPQYIIAVLPDCVA